MSAPRPPIPWHPDPAEMVRNCPSCREDYSNATPCACAQAVTFAPDGWDERIEAPVDEQVESLRYAEPADDTDLPEWYGNFCMSCNHPHSEGDCDPGEAL